MVKLLLQQPEIVVDLCDDLRQTPLHWATSNAHHDVVKLLKRVKTNSMEQETENRIDVLKVNAMTFETEFLKQNFFFIFKSFFRS